MKQLVQDFSSGEIKLVEVPAPAVRPGMVLVRNAASVVSAGTERSTVAMGQASLLGKARMRPDLARQVLKKLRTEGVGATLRKVRAQLESWKALGYSSAGTIIEVGEGVEGLAVGDRVACAGQDYASHAELVVVPQNLVVKLPDEVAFEHGAFATLGAIALHGVRQARAQLGEHVAVIGLGLIGQLTVQILRAAGCRVFGFDPRSEAMARAGVARPSANSMDAVIITASTTSNEPLVTAGEWCRDRGRVVLVGVTGMEVPRDLYYRKELEFCVSRSYGPGRYDPLYEEYGLDYPIGYVRWTERRNMEAFVELVAAGRVDVGSLITHKFALEDAPRAYEVIAGKSDQPVVGVVIRYGEAPVVRTKRVSQLSPGPVVLGMIGAGNYGQGVLLPLLKAQPGVALATVCTATGVKAEKVREKFGFAASTTDWRSVVEDPQINTVVVATRHDMHARIVAAALRAGKTVFCEKPLCLSEEELEEILEAGSERLMVGFNRRFAPFSAKVRAVSGPRVMWYRVNAGPLPVGHWASDPTQGGRVLGEACHFVDYLQFAAQARPVHVFAQGFGADNVQIAMRFADGSVGVVDYFGVGDKELPKEYFEVSGGGRTVQVEDFRDKGQGEMIRRFVEAAKSGGPMPVGFDELVTSTRATLAVVRSLQTGQAVML
ncbi:MAG: bi-domain-containing oxidoreductase [Verrucomicrobiae bacterium]|nr:bi-domain-containing oxidoreductase [Verrucomicrobiae bacterium]